MKMTKEERKHRQKLQAMDRYYNQKIAGECTIAGCRVKPDDENSLLCSIHREMSALRSRQWKRRKRVMQSILKAVKVWEARA